MSLSLSSFIQMQGVGWLTWAIVVVVVLLAMFLIFFFVKRISKAEKETEDEWGLAQRSLFTNAVLPIERPGRAATRTAELDEVEPTLPESPPESVPRPVGETSNLASSKEAGETAKTELLRSVPAVEPEPAVESPRPVPDEQPALQEPQRQDEERGTELLASRRLERVDRPAEQPGDAAPFDDQVWAGLEIDEQSSRQTPSGQTQALDASSFAVSSFEETSEEPQKEVSQRDASQTDASQTPPREARVDHRRREMFEPPVIEPVRRRESYEQPVIEPLESPDEPPAARRKAVEARPVAADRNVRQQASPPLVVTAGPPGRMSERRSGSVLNLPAEASDAPMVYGEVSPDRGTRAIGSLSNYGKNVDDSKGRGWKWLLVLVGVVVAAVLMYYFVRPFNAWVDRWYAEVRGKNLAASKPPPAPEYKAQVLLARGQISNTNAVAKARGRVINTSDAPLENLSVEVELIRKDGAPPDIRTAPVNPATLAPSQQGIFEVDLDSRVHSGHKLSKLFSKDGEVPFTAPGQTKQQAQ